MENTTKLTFSIQDINIDSNEQSDSRFAKVKIFAFADGENSHTSPVSLEVLKRSSEYIYDIPVCTDFVYYTYDGLGAHSEEEVPVGFVYRKDNPVSFEYDKLHQKTFLVIEALIWKKYSNNFIKIIKKSGGIKKVSVEISYTGHPDKNGETILDTIVYQCITILSDEITEACKGCHAEMLSFSNDKNEYMSTINFGDSIRIVNTKEKAVDGEWVNPRRKLFNPISEASNSKALLKEAYLITDFTTEKLEITKFKYPHHIVKNNELVIQKRGLEAAFQRASAQGIVNGKVKAHLLRHYKELGLNTENFAEFGMSEQDFSLYFADNIESAGESNMSKLEEKQVDEKMACEGKEDMAKKLDETKVEKDEKELSKDKKFSDEEKEDDDEKSEVSKSNVKEEDARKDEEKEEETVDEEKEEDMSCKMAELEAKCAELEASNKVYMEKIASMADYEELKGFKHNAEENAKKQEDIQKMQEVMSEIEGRGVVMSSDDKTELMAKFSEFQSFDAWSNYTKAQCFDKVENVDGITRIGLGYPNNISSTGSIWDNI